MRLGKRERKKFKEFIKKFEVDETFNIHTSTKNPNFWNMRSGRVMQNYKGSIKIENFGKCVFGSGRV